MADLTIDEDDLELVLDHHEGGHDSPTVNDYMTAVSYSQPTRLGREAALVLMRRAFVTALSSARAGRRRLKPSHARGYVLRQENYVREAMNTVDALPVSTLLWNPHWPPYRSCCDL